MLRKGKLDLSAIVPIKPEREGGAARAEGLYIYICAKPSNVGVHQSAEGGSVRDFFNAQKHEYACNGGYFDPGAAGARIPTGLVISEGRVEWSGSRDYYGDAANLRGEYFKSGKYSSKAAGESEWYGVFFVSENGRAGVASTGQFEREYGVLRENGTGAYSGIRTALEAGPVLIEDGKRMDIASKHPELGRFSRRRVRRNAVGVTRKGDVVFFASNGGTALAEFAKNASEAVRARGDELVGMLNLDGGNSMQNADSGGVNPNKRTVANFIYVKQGTESLAKR